MAEAVVSFVLEQLGELLVESVKDEAKFLRGVGDQVERAKAELRLMRGFLKGADARARGGDERVRIWVDEIREATYELEDAILTYAAEVTDLRREGGFRNVVKRLACLFCEGVTLHRVGSKIEKISNDILSLRSSLKTYGIRELPASGSDGASSSDVRRRELRRDYSHIVEPDIVGLDKDVNKLVACLTESGASHRVVSICGMGGLGYEGHFWVYIDRLRLSRTANKIRRRELIERSRLWIHENEQINGGTMLEEVVVLEVESLEDVTAKSLIGDRDFDDLGIAKATGRRISI